MLDDTACTTGVSNGSAPGDVPVHGQLGSLVTTQFPCGACDRASAIKFSSNGPARTLSIPLCECTWLNKSLSRPAVRVRLVRLSGDSVPLAWVHLWERSATQPARLRAVCGLFTKGQLAVAVGWSLGQLPPQRDTCACVQLTVTAELRSRRTLLPARSMRWLPGSATATQARQRTNDTSRAGMQCPSGLQCVNRLDGLDDGTPEGTASPLWIPTGSPLASHSFVLAGVPEVPLGSLWLPLG